MFYKSWLEIIYLLSVQGRITFLDQKMFSSLKNENQMMTCQEKVVHSWIKQPLQYNLLCTWYCTMILDLLQKYTIHWLSEYYFYWMVKSNWELNAQKCFAFCYLFWGIFTQVLRLRFLKKCLELYFMNTKNMKNTKFLINLQYRVKVPTHLIKKNLHGFVISSF
jgi:hypothetical protein